MRRLWKEEWTTHTDFVPSYHADEFTIRAFHGEYEVTVTYYGYPIKYTGFHVWKGEDTVVDVIVD